jgi:outer membrane protein TolC
MPLSTIRADDSVRTLSLDAYLQQVKEKNEAYVGAEEKREGSKGIRREADIVFSPSFFANAESKSDEKQDFAALYDKTEKKAYSSGISQTSPFGLTGKLYYAYEDTTYNSLSQSDRYYNASPVLELSLPVWQNAFGRTTRGNEASIRAQAEASEWSAESDRKILLVNAEIAYWQLIIARELVVIQEQGLEASQSIYDYDKKQADMNLTDKADVLQAGAELESKKLDLKSVRDDERSVLRRFNAYRNVVPEDASFALPAIDYERIQGIGAIPRFEGRADVKAAEATARATAANARITEENNKPVLNLYVAYALNGGAGRPSDAYSDSFTCDRPTTTVGFTFSVPLDFYASNDARSGGRRIEKAARLSYEQKLKDQDADWNDLVTKLKDAHERLAMSHSIVAAQKEKLEYERDRLKRGRTTTYQVLQFQQDYLNSELVRANAANDILSLRAAINLYGDVLPQRSIDVAIIGAGAMPEGAAQ